MIFALSAILFFMVLRFVVSLFNFLSDPKLRRVARSYNHKLSILIPARNEEPNILNLLRSIHQQDYQNYEVIILDDNSTDNTFGICEKFAAAHSKFSVVKGKQLPPDWLGKNYACYQLAKIAQGDYLLFLDADVAVENGLINSALHRADLKKLALLSLYGNTHLSGWGSYLVAPLVPYVLLSLLPLQLVYIIKSKTIAAANGQFMLFDANTYHKKQWHREVKNKAVEATEIARLIKAGGFNAETLLGNQLLISSSTGGYLTVVNEFSKNFLAAFNYNVLSLLVYLIVLLGGPLIIIATLNINLIVFMCGLIILNRIMISLTASQSVWKNLLLHPVQMINLMLIAFLGIQHYLTRTTVWKGRKV